MGLVTIFIKWVTPILLKIVLEAVSVLLSKTILKPITTYYLKNNKKYDQYLYM